MTLIVNGKNETLSEHMTLAEFIKNKKFNSEVIVVEHNFKIAAKSEWDTITLKENDVLEIISFVGGG